MPHPGGGVEATICPGNDALWIAHGVGDAFQAFRHYFGVLHEIGHGIDDAGYQDLILSERVLFDDAMLVSVTGIGQGKNEPTYVRRHDSWKNVLHRHIAIVRTLVVPPAGMHSNTIGGDVNERLVDSRDYDFDEVDELAERLILESRVPLERQIGAVKLEEKPIAYDGFVFNAQRVAQSLQVTFKGIVVLILHDRRHDPWRGCG